MLRAAIAILCAACTAAGAFGTLSPRAAQAVSPASSPPAAGVGYGTYERTVEELPDVRGALIDDDGAIVAALGSGGVVRIQVDGTRSTLVPWWPAGQVAYAGAIARSSDGGYLVVDTPRAQVVHIAANGTRTIFADLAVLALPPRASALCTDGGRVLIADSVLPRVLVVDAGGTAVAQWEIPTPAGGLTPRLAGIAAGGGHIFVSDAANCRVVRLDPKTGAVTREWGDRGAFPGMFEMPAGLAWAGNALLVTDTLNHRVVRSDAEGNTLDAWGMHAVQPREGRGRIHYPVTAAATPDGTRVVVAEPFERRVQVFSARAPRDPSVPERTPLPANDGIASHFNRELAVDGQTLLVYEPESAAALVFDMRSDPPIHVTTIGGPGRTPGQFGQVASFLVDEKANRIYCVDVMRDTLLVFALRRAGGAPKFDPFMGRLVAEVPLAPIAQFTAQRAGGPPALVAADLQRTPSGGFCLLDAGAGRVVELDANLRPVNAWGAPKGAGRLINPTQMVVTPAGEALIVDASDRAIKRYAMTDGSFRGVIALPESKRPWGITIVGDGADVRYAVTDAGGDALLIVAPQDGAVTARAVARGDKPGEFWEPSAVAYSPRDGRLYVTDHGNHRLQSFQPDGTWESSFGIGRPFVRPRDPNAPQRPVSPPGVSPSSEGGIDTLAQFPAAVRQPDGWWLTPSTHGRYAVRWRTVPEDVPLRDPFAVEATIVEVHTGQPFTGTLAVDARMPHHHHGMNIAPTITQTGAGAWRADNMLFHMPGYWEIYFDVIDAGRLERAQAEVMLE